MVVLYLAALCHLVHDVHCNSLRGRVKAMEKSDCISIEDYEKEELKVWAFL